MITKVLRVELVKPVNADWKIVGPKLREMQRLTAEALNFCMRKYYIEAAEKLEVIKAQGIKPTRKNLEVIGKSYCEILGQKYSDKFSSYVYAAISNIARKRFDNDWFDLLVRGEKSLSTYRADCPIYVAKIGKYGVHIREQENGAYQDRFIGLQFSPQVNNRVEKTEFLISNKSLDESRQPLWDRLLQGQYKLGMVQLLYKKRIKKWMANISYTFAPDRAKDLDEKIRVGVDLGLSVPVYLAVNNAFTREVLREEGETIQSFRRQIEHRRNRLRRNERGILERRAGHGRQHKIGSIEKLRELESNFRRTANHRLSRGVINFALKHRAGVIVMEDLEGYYDQKCEDSFLKTWTYFELQTMIAQKAAEVGIKAEKVKPEYTSQRCSKCGHIDKENRKSRDFCCTKCGNKLHADFNAARNLATPDIENLIKGSLKDKTTEAAKEKS